MAMLLEVITRQAKFWKITDLRHSHTPLTQLSSSTPSTLRPSSPPLRVVSLCLCTLLLQSIDHLIRIARRSPLALQYLHQHTSEVEPLLTFLTTNPEPPVPRSFAHHLPSPSSSIPAVEACT